jgi:hypothetical protein
MVIMFLHPNSWVAIESLPRSQGEPDVGTTTNLWTQWSSNHCEASLATSPLETSQTILNNPIPFLVHL